MASSLSVVMSATQTSSRAAPTSAVISGFISTTDASLSRPLGLRLGAQIDRAAHADVVEMVVKEAPRGTLAVHPQHLEVVVVRGHLADVVEVGADRLERDAMHVDAPV